MTNVVELEPQELGENFRFDPDKILDEAKGQGFETLVIMGQKPSGEVWVSGNANRGELLVLIEVAKHQIVFDEN